MRHFWQLASPSRNARALAAPPWRPRSPLRARALAVALALGAMVSAAATGCATAQSAGRPASSLAAHKRASHKASTHHAPASAAGSAGAGAREGDDATGDDGEEAANGSNGGNGANGGEGERDLAAVAVTEGAASFYHDALAGKPTANGEKYEPEGETCAHRTLPFGTVLVVEDIATGKKAHCRVNDRGPYVDGRLIDVSRKVARDLGMLERGVIRVRIRVARPPGAS